MKPMLIQYQNILIRTYKTKANNMKKMNSTLICIALLFCTLQHSYTQVNKLEFGIFETVPLNDLRPFSENLSKFILNQELDLDSPVLGYVNINNVAFFDSLFTEATTPKMNLMLTRPNSGPTGNSYAIVALKEEAFIDISDISKTIPRVESVEIRFTSKGTKKWADMTNANTGKTIAFTVNNEVWSLPMVNAEIRSGVAMIGGIKDEKTSRDLSDLINSAINK